MHTLLTASSGLILIACIYLAWAMQHRSNRVERAANRLQAAIARVAALEGEVASLTTQLQKLRGTFYAFRATFPEQEPDQPMRANQASEKQIDVEDAIIGPVCDNWLQAKIDGPRSRAANCECGYCESARAARENFRRSAVPARVSKIRNGAQ